MWFGKSIYLQQADAVDIVDGEEVTLLRWGNVIVNKVIKNNNGVVTKIECTYNVVKGDVKKTKKKIHWVANTLSKFACYHFTSMLNKIFFLQIGNFPGKNVISKLK